MNGSACMDILSLEQNGSTNPERQVSNEAAGCRLGQPRELWPPVQKDRQIDPSGPGVSFHSTVLPDTIHGNHRACFGESLGSRVLRAVSKALSAIFLLCSIHSTHFHFTLVASFTVNAAKSSWQQSLEKML